MQADTTVVYKSSTYMYDFWGGFAVGTTSGYNAINKINYMSVHKVSEEQLDKIAIKKITKIRVGDALGYANKEWKKRNPLGVYLYTLEDFMGRNFLQHCIHALRSYLLPHKGNQKFSYPHHIYQSI